VATQGAAGFASFTSLLLDSPTPPQQQQQLMSGQVQPLPAFVVAGPQVAVEVGQHT
jgi:hypothetical protein